MVKVKSSKRRRNDGGGWFDSVKASAQKAGKSIASKAQSAGKSIATSAQSAGKSIAAGAQSAGKSIAAGAQKTANNAKILYLKNKISSEIEKQIKALEEVKKLKEKEGQALNYFDNLNETDNLDFKTIEENFNKTLTQFSLKTSVDGARFRRTKKRSQKKRRSRK